MGLIDSKSRGKVNGEYTVAYAILCAHSASNRKTIPLVRKKVIFERCVLQLFASSSNTLAAWISPLEFRFVSINDRTIEFTCELQTGFYADRWRGTWMLFFSFISFFLLLLRERFWIILKRRINDRAILCGYDNIVRRMLKIFWR